MKVAYITRAGFGLLGGAASYMYPTCAARHCDVEVLSPFLPDTSEPAVFSADQLTVRNVYDKSKNRVVQNIFMHLDRFRPDIVHMFHNPNCLLYTYTLRKLFPETKWILDFRSPIVAVKKKFRREMMWRYFYTQFYVDRILTHSQLTIKDNIPIRFRSCQEMLPGVDISKFPVCAYRSKKSKKFLYVGSIVPVRKLDRLIAGFVKFIHQGKSNCTLDLIGDGEARESLEELVSAEGMGKHIRFKGVLPQDELYSIMHKYDVGVAYVPYEKFSRAPSLKSLEYAAAKLPVIASDTEGHIDYTIRFGFRFNLFDNSIAGICAALESAHQDVSELDILHNRSVVERFDWDYIVRNDLLPVYEQLLSMRK